MEPGDRGARRVERTVCAARAARAGEDAYFAFPISRSFGVADGVGGWAEARKTTFSVGKAKTSHRTPQNAP